MKPRKIKTPGNKKLYILWDDGEESHIPLNSLRRLCPCATCITERASESASYIPLLFDAQTQIQSLSAVGNYAIQINWKDGHNTGLYEFPYLRKISESIKNKEI